MNLSSFTNQYFAFLSIAVVAAGAGMTMAPSGNSAQDSALEWDNTITVEKNGVQIARFHNNLTDQGKNYIAGELFGGGVNDAKTSSNNFSYISVGVAYQENMINDSSSEPSKFVPNEYTEYNLTRKKADEKSYSGSTYTLKANFQANLTDEYTLDSGDNPQDVTVNVTGLNYGNHSRTGDPLSNSHENATLVSGGAFNSPATLSDGDKLTVTHEITISDGN